MSEHFHRAHHDQPGSPQPSTRGTDIRKSDSFGKLTDSSENVEDHTDEYPHNGKSLIKISYK